jgi:hypothetical protein
MKTQLLHEHHNLQDKAKKPHYRPEMLERGRSDTVPTASSRLIARAGAREDLLQTIRKHRFVYSGVNFKFGWNLEVFAKKNSLPADDEGTKRAMETVRQAAQRDVDAFAVRIKVAPIRKQGILYHFDYDTPQTECQMLRK